MSDTAITNLRNSIVSKAGGPPFALDSAYLTQALNDPSVSVPASYDGDIHAAFQVDASAFLVGIASAGDIGPVQDNSFTVSNASIPFLGSVLQSAATIVFGLTVQGTVLVVQIESAPANWTWTDSFAFMNGWPFNLLSVSNADFIFSTADGAYPWAVNSGKPVEGGARQNFFCKVAFPDIAKPLLSLFNGVQAPSGLLNFQGVFDMSAYDGSTVIFPSGTFTALVSGGTFQLLYLTIANPSLTLRIPPPDDPKSQDKTDQAPMLSISCGINIGDSGGGPSPYTLQIQVPAVISPGQEVGQANNYTVGLYATGEGSPLTPATIVALVGNTGSYFGAVPPVLQQFLTFVELQGLVLTGQLGTSPTIASISVEIGSNKNTSWTPIPDPTGALDFTIKSFSLQWSINNPFDSGSREQSFLFNTQFTLAPAVFKGAGGVGDGLFTVQFNSGLQFYAAFDGTATLSDFVNVLSGGALSLPPSIQASLSDIRLNVDYTAQSFSFTSGFDLAIDFLTIAGKPILSVSQGQVKVAASTPTQNSQGGAAGTSISPNAKKNTAWQSEISGLMAVGPLGANASIGYDSTQSPARWLLKASLAETIDVQELINQFFNPSGLYDFPAFLPGNLKVTAFDIEATIPSGTTTAATSYSIATTFSWIFQLGEQSVGIDNAKITLQYDGSKPSGQQFSGSAIGTWVYSAINLELVLGYKFVPSTTGTNHILFLEWQGFHAEYESGKEQITFTLKGWSVGSLIQALVRTLGDPYFTLSSPWDLLNSISLDGLSLAVSLKSNETNRISASYTLSSPINLGFIRIDGLIFRRDTTGKVTLAIKGSAPDALKKEMGNLLNPDKGQDVKDMPKVPGRGQSYFKVFLLGLGQRIGITGYTTFNSVKEAITALEKLPSTTGNENPVNPNANEGNPPKGLPYYNKDNNWLIAGHLGLLQVAGVWTIDAMVVFNDPNLYGLRLALAGPRAGGLANLAIDILYKKITDDVGVFQIDFTFPDAIRNLNFGSVSITLPQLGIKVYTNGDFFVDIGFPYNLDFRRSFSIAVIVYFVPILGSGGIYFGKLSNATATQVPKTNAGTFDPVIIFGLGLQLGLGYNFTKGPLSAGFALTVFGIVEGVIAAWHPYPQTSLPSSNALATTDSSLQDSYYFKLSGTVGVIGLLYGKIDFAIIQASVNVKITVSLKLTYESYRAIPLIVTATVDISVEVKIDLGLFSITISFSFSATVSAKFIIGSDSQAPWDSLPQQKTIAARSLHFRNAGPLAAFSMAQALRPRPKQVVSRTNAPNPVLNLVTAPQFTVLAPEGATNYSAQQGAMVFLFAMDAPTATSPSNAGDSSFDKLCAAYFPWVIDTLKVSTGDFVDLKDVQSTIVTQDELTAFVNRLADNQNPPISITDLLNFLKSTFILNIQTPENADITGTKQKLQQGAMVFPVFDGLSLSVPNTSGSGNNPITFESYTATNLAYRAAVAALFAQVEAVIAKEGQEPPQTALAIVETLESMAAVFFTDTFSIIGRQLLQAAEDSLQAFPYPLQATDSIQSIMDWAGAFGNVLTVDDIVLPNQSHQLTPGIQMSIAGLSYTIQAGDTLSAIALRYSDLGPSPRWTTTPAQLIEANPMTRCLQPGVALPLQGPTGPVVYTTTPGDTFDNIAQSVGISLNNLASQAVLYDRKDLLSPAVPANIPVISYRTASGPTASDPSPDTLSSVAQLFGSTVSQLAAANMAVLGLFSIKAEGGILTLANLHAMSVGALWAAIVKTDQVAQTAGMVSRFLMFGLRLPNQTGLTLSDQFLYPKTQTAFAAYQLTGQEFPTPPSLVADAQYTISVSRADFSHGVDLSFIQFNGQSIKTATVDLTGSYNRLSVVLDWAKTGAFQPSPSLEVLPLSQIEAKGFAIANFAFWSTSDMSKLLALTNRGQGVPSGAQSKPVLWALPPGLLSQIGPRQSLLQGQFPDLASVVPVMPRFLPQAGSHSPATGQTTYTNINNWAWTTRVDFQIKKLPSVAVAAVTNTGSGSTPQGPASAPELANIYEIVGPTSEDSLLLQNILTAMDQLGSGIVSSVFLLYAQSNSSTTSLVTLGDQEFLSFITQTNLSTETNPEKAVTARLFALAGQEPRGIANSPAEFIKLMWELGVVRSGGYYLYYQVVDGGSGLPASIFDANGTATLTMAVTYSTTGIIGNSLLEFINGFVSTDAVNTEQDVVRVLSQFAGSSSAPLKGNETLASIAAVYGASPGRVVELNSAVALSSGKIIPISGIVRQLVQSDLTEPPQTLNKLAAYYSVGAVIPITAQQIQDMNPGVTVQLGAVYYIPDISYAVSSASPGPGNTFASMAAYYGISLQAVAVKALNTSGLFPANAVLIIDTEMFDLRQTLDQGNLNFQMERANLGIPPELPPNPTEPQKIAYAQAYMYSLYNTLSAGFEQNVFFTRSPWGLPFGPQHFSDQQQPDAAMESHARRMHQRTAMLQAAASDDFTYRQALGYASVSTVNPAPEGGNGLPPRASNPYIGVGSTAQIALRWQDIFGNTTITPFENPPASYTGALNGSAAQVLYNDLLVALSAWPNTKASYIYGLNGSAPEFQLHLAFFTEPYNNDLEQARRDLRLYQTVYFQLHQNYKNAGVPGVTGNAVSMILNNSLLATPELTLSDAQADIIRDYISNCVKYLSWLVNKTPQVPAPEAQLNIAVQSSAIAAGNIIELDVALIFRRQARLVDSRVAALADGLAVSSTILAHADGGSTVAYTEFAKSFESVFQTDNWYLKVGEGLKQLGEDSSGQTHQLWAARFGKQKGQGIYFEIGPDPSYYAPKPVAKSLVSQSTTIVDYATGQPMTVSFSGVDLNLWFQACLDAVDTFLSAKYSSSAFILDKLLGTSDPLKDGYLGKVLAAKQMLADDISSTVKPILSTSATDPSTRAAAAEKLRQQLLNQIGAAYAAGAVLVYGLSNVSGGPAQSPSGPPNLYGQPIALIQGKPLNQNYSLTSARIPLGVVNVKDSQGQLTSFDPRLSFVFGSKNITQQAYVPLDLSLNISHLEFDRSSVPGIEGYVQSRWLAFVQGPFNYTLGASTANVPVVNRSLPTPPTMQEQLASKTSNPLSPVNLAQWTYSFRYLYTEAAQDAIHATMEFNLPGDSTPPQAKSATGNEPDLFTALAQFVTSWPAISRDFNQYLVTIGTKEPDQETIDQSTKAVSAFEQYVTDVAKAYHATLQPRFLAAFQPPDLIKVAYEVKLKDRDGIAQTDIFNLKINDLDATWNAENNTISNGPITLPAMVVEIQPEEYQAQTVPPNPGINISYIYQGKTQQLPYLDALSDPERTISMAGLNALFCQNAWSAVFVKRNEILFPDSEIGKVSTTDDFLFQTPVVRFADAIVPHLTHAEFPLGDTGLEQSLNTFFEQMFTGGTGNISVAVAMASGYSYTYLPDVPRVFLPISMLPPCDTPVVPTVPPEFTAPLAASIEAWRISRKPTTGGDPQVNFTLKMFGTLGSRQPLVIVDDLQWAVTQ